MRVRTKVQIFTVLNTLNCYFSSNGNINSGCPPSRPVGGSSREVSLCRLDSAELTSDIQVDGKQKISIKIKKVVREHILMRTWTGLCVWVMGQKHGHGPRPRP